MRQRKMKKRHRIVLTGIVLCLLGTVVCTLQLRQVKAQLQEQEELLTQVSNVVRILQVEAAEAGVETGQEVRTGAASLKNHQIVEEAAEASYAELCGLEQVEKPRERTYRQVLEKLAELGEEDQRIAEIRENYEAYPDRLLEALANNPEMADFVQGYPEAEHRATGGLTEREKQEEYPLFLQWDPRWGYAPYGDDSCIALSGCGPTCLSMVLYYLTGDESLTPDLFGEYSMENDYYLSGTGTLWALLEETAPLYGVTVDQPDPSEEEMKAALDQGGILICSMGPGDFTAGGHFVVVYGYD
ncbi:MAG: C39 family peptidase, partial [Lachnospiraceae bacterium]|nr:C39 family peptidase [Lachnospiraceae bacterium]